MLTNRFLCFLLDFQKFQIKKQTLNYQINIQYLIFKSIIVGSLVTDKQ